MSGRRPFYTLTAALLWASAVPALAAPASSAAPYNCEALDKLTLKDSSKAYPEAVKECIRRGWEPPPEWKVNKGVNSGVRVSGSMGFSNSTVTGPRDTGGSRGINASVKSDILKFSCNFPPRVKLGIPPKLDIPKGSCWDFFAGILKDKNAPSTSTTATPTAPAAGIDSNLCPAESDTTGAFGTRAALVGGSTSLSCGGMVPLSATDLVLNANPTGLATTEEGSYYIWLYRKSGSGFLPSVSAAKLPTYLCTEISMGESGTIMQKTVDLTPPVAQMITFDGGTGHISIRLQSRETMDSGFIPAYTEGETEKYLIIPIAADGTPTIPTNCAEDSTYFQPLTSRQDIVVHSSTMSGCEGITATPTVFNDAQVVCPVTATQDAATGKCLDINGMPVAATIVNDWKTICPSGAEPVNGACEETTGIPAEMSCSSGKGTSANTNCSTSSMILDGSVNASCAGKTQYSVLDRPNLHYPPGSTPRFYSIEGRSAFMADTLNGSRFYTQGQTSIYLQATAPAITLPEGGMIRFANSSTLIMGAVATVDVANKKITLAHGGQLVSTNGTQIQAFAAGESYTIPAGAYVLPLEVQVERSLTLPAGFTLPTTPKLGTLAPYVRLPADAPPQ